MTYVLGVDPGVISGWALVGGRPARPIVWGQVGARGRRMTGAEVHDVLQQCGAEIPADQWPPVLAIEGQFIPPDGGAGGRHRAHAASSLLTARCAGVWIGLAERYGLPAYQHKGEPAIPPQTWRAGVWGGRWTTEAAKRHAVELAAQLWGIRILKTHHHTAEAAWIGLYALEELRAQASQQQLPGVAG